MDIKKSELSILKTLSESNTPKAEDLELSKEEFGGLVEDLLEKGYLENAEVVRGGQGHIVQCVVFLGSRVTIRGLEYLQENQS